MTLPRLRAVAMSENRQPEERVGAQGTPRPDPRRTDGWPWYSERRRWEMSMA
jgi:hypothetical protein